MVVSTQYWYILDVALEHSSCWESGNNALHGVFTSKLQAICLYICTGLTCMWMGWSGDVHTHVFGTGWVDCRPLLCVQVF